ncbi:MAG: shikimate kinase [Oscillospiraceae bacterium]
MRRPDGSLYGDNTDAWGFSETIRRMGINCAGKKALISRLGGAFCDGAIRASPAWGPDGGDLPKRSAQLPKFGPAWGDAAILVNATPVGMYPDNEQSPLSLSCLPRLEAVCDLIYNPARTRLLLDAEARGIACTNGLYMLVAQAARSSELFTGKSISREIQEAIAAQVGADMENWILIGMPGCGKSRTGALLARRTGRPFVDADRELERRAGMSIPAFLRRHGEAAFRTPGNPGAPGSGERLRADHRHWRRLCHPRGKPPGPAPEWPDHLAATAPGLP